MRSGVEIEIVQMRGTPADLGQEIGAADHLIEASGTDRGKDFANLCCVEGDEVDDLVGVCR